jgi:hypothetical protein
MAKKLLIVLIAIEHVIMIVSMRMEIKEIV